jgi:4-amino-4-deoxy-L-arabinose transferase-like glycosyltransferase
MIDQIAAYQDRLEQAPTLREKRLGTLIVLLLLLALFLNLGLHPLKHEEPRRALVALEMLFRDNLLVPTEVGAFYYNKPPVYNWLIILSYKLFGNYSELAVRFFSVLSFLGMGGLLFAATTRYLGSRLALYSSLFFMLCADLLFYFSLTAEIDFFYSLVTFTGFLVIYHFERKQAYWTLFLLTYLLTAIGTLTKGLPSIAFTGITLLAWFSYQRKFLRLFHPAHFAGLGVFLLLVGGYFWAYSQYNDPSGFLTRLFSESSRRTVAENGLLALLGHLLHFPLINLVNLLPAAFLLPFLFSRSFFSKLRQHSFLSFVLITLLANLPIYLLSPGAKARYMYMLYPLVVLLLTAAYFVQDRDWKQKAEKLLQQLIFGLIILMILAGGGLPFLPPLQEAVTDLWIPALLCSGGASVVLLLYLRRPQLRTLSLLLLVVWARVIFDLTVLPVRAAEGSAAQDKIDARLITEMTEGAPLHVLQGSMISRTTIFYIERERQQVLNFEDKELPGHFYMAYRDSLLNTEHQPLYTFTYQKDTLVLFKFK